LKPLSKLENGGNQDPKEQLAKPPSKKKLDPKDFMFIGLKGESKVKPPG
jgi:hypothetical protein